MSSQQIIAFRPTLLHFHRGWGCWSMAMMVPLLKKPSKYYKRIRTVDGLILQTSFKWKVRKFIASQIIDDRRFATAPWSHEHNQWLRKDFRIAKVTVTQIAIFVKSFQWLDGILINFLQVIQRFIGNFCKGLILCDWFVVQMKNFIDMTAISKVFWNFGFLQIINVIIISSFDQFIRWK